MTHVIIGNGNLGNSLAKEIDASGDCHVMVSKSTGYSLENIPHNL